jgi:hypothetical protein
LAVRFVDGGEPEHLAPVVPLFPGVGVPAAPEQAMDAADSGGLARDGAEGALL